MWLQQCINPEWRRINPSHWKLHQENLSRGLLLTPLQSGEHPGVMGTVLCTVSPKNESQQIHRWVFASETSKYVFFILIGSYNREKQFIFMAVLASCKPPYSPTSGFWPSMQCPCNISCCLFQLFDNCFFLLKGYSNRVNSCLAVALDCTFQIYTVSLFTGNFSIPWLLHKGLFSLSLI